QDSGTRRGASRDGSGAAAHRRRGAVGEPGGVGAGRRAAGRRDDDAAAGGHGARTGCRGGAGREPRGADDFGARPARHVDCRRALAARAGRAAAWHADASPHARCDARDRDRTTAGVGHAGLARHRRRYRRGPESIMTNGIRIAPSVLSADLARLADQVAQVLEAGADWLHVDVMDGRFVPNLTFDANMIAALRKLTDKPIDVHLMVVEPENFIESFAAAGASVFTFHPEATVHVQRQLDAVKQRGMMAGLALNAGTPLAHGEEVIRDIYLLLIMTVNPRFGGQSYLPASNEKIQRAHALRTTHNARFCLEVDGGITAQTIGEAHQ